MAEMKTTSEEAGRKAQYTTAVTIHSGVEHAAASEVLQQRTVVTSKTQGIVALRYAPRTPKASEPVDTTN